MNDKLEVIINGVRYIPAKQALANEKEIAKGLLMFYWGVVSDEKAEKLMNDSDIRVYVNDNGQGESIREILDEIARISKEK